MATTMTTKNHGSWSDAAGTPAQVTSTLALPGSWRWYPAATTVLVRADQVANLPP
jgi:hypothetical protein